MEINSSKLDPNHFLVRLSNYLDWDGLNLSLNGLGPARERRLIARLYILIKLIKVPPHDLINQLRENVYWQFFLGFKEFKTQLPFDSKYVTDVCEWVVQKKFEPTFENELKKTERTIWLKTSVEGAAFLERERIDLFCKKIQNLKKEKSADGATKKKLTYSNPPPDFMKQVIRALGAHKWWVMKVELKKTKSSPKLTRTPLAWTLQSNSKDFQTHLDRGDFNAMDLFLVQTSSRSTTVLVDLSTFPEGIMKRPERLARQGKLELSLKNPLWISQYYEALCGLYSKNSFSKEAFNTLLDQVKTACQISNQLRDRLFWPDYTGQYLSIAPFTASYGRGIHLDQFNQAFSNWRKNLGATEGTSSSQFFDPIEYEIRRNEIQGFAKNRLSKLRESWETQSDESQQPKNKKQRLSEQGKFYRELKKDVELQKIAQAALLLQIDNDRAKYVIGNEPNPDLFFSWINYLQQNPHEVVTNCGLDDPSGLIATLARSFVPPLSVWLENRETFPENSKMRTKSKRTDSGGYQPNSFEFFPFDRKIHAIWKGIYQFDCLGGAIGYPKSLTPERWAAITLEGAEFYHILRNNSVVGTLQLVPVRINDRIYGSVEMTGNVVFSQAMFIDPDTHSPRLFSIFEIWLKHFRDRIKVKNWAGLVVNEKNLIHGKGEISPFKTSLAFNGTPCLESANAVTLVDQAYADEIVALSEKKSYNRSGPHTRYAGKMIVDATVGKSGVFKLATDF